MDVQPVSWSSPGNPSRAHGLTEARQPGPRRARTQSPRPRAGPQSLELAGLRPAPAGPLFPKSSVRPGEKPPPRKQSPRTGACSEAPDGRKARLPRTVNTRWAARAVPPGPTHEARQGQGHTASGGPNTREEESQPGPERPDPLLEGPACQKSWERSPDPCDRARPVTTPVTTSCNRLKDFAGALSAAG